MAGKSSQWKSMLQKTNDLVSQIPLDTEGIPPLQRDAAQLQAAAQRLVETQKEQPEEEKEKAIRLLGHKAFEADKLQKELLQVIPVEEEGQVPQYEDHIHQIFATAIDEAIEATTIESELQTSKLLDDDWARERQELLDELEHEGNWLPPQKDSSEPVNGELLPNTPFTRSPIGSHAFQTSVKPVSFVDSKMNIYMSVLEENRGSPESTTLLEMILDANKDYSKGSQDITLTWELLYYIVKDEEFGARKFLELQYQRFIERQLQAGTLERSAKLSLDTLSQVRGWLKVARSMPGLGSIADNLKFYSEIQNSLEEPLDISSGLPLWAVAYYCLRCGSWADASKLLDDALQKNRIPAHEKCIVEGLKELVRHDFRAPLSDSLYANIQSAHDVLQTGQRAYDPDANQSNPWKKAIFQLLAADPSDTLDRCINASIQDFLWFKLSCALSKNNPRYNKADVAHIILSNGPDHFNGNKNPYLYTRILMECDEFEQAIGFLATASREAETEAVHLAICMKDLNLITVEDAIPGRKRATFGHRNHVNETPLVIVGDRSKGGTSYLVLGKLIQKYVSRFAVSNPKAAILYILELRPSNDAYEYLKALLIESGKLEEILDGGEREFQSDFLNQGGYLFQLLSEDRRTCIRTIQEAAKAAESQGLFYVAVELYLRGGTDETFNQAVDLLNKQIVHKLHPSSESREKWKKLLQSVSQHSDVLAKLTKDRRVAFEQLKKLFKFYDLCKTKEWQQAVDSISWLFPSSRSDVHSCVSQFRYLDEDLKHAFPIAYEAALHALFEIYQHAKHTHNSNKMSQLREQFQAYSELFSNLPIQTAQLARVITDFEVKMT